MDVTAVLSCYEKWTLGGFGKTNPIQTQSRTMVLPPLFVLFDFFYFLEAVEPAAIYAGTSLNCSVPGSRISQIVRPERPASALGRPNRINCAFFPVVSPLQKYTVFTPSLFNKRCPQPDLLQCPLPQLCGGLFEKIRDDFKLRPADPDVTFRRSGAASAAANTFEMQAADIPLIVVFGHFLPFQDGTGVGACGHRGVFRQAAFGDSRLRRQPAGSALS
jgi:hypothetical protein